MTSVALGAEGKMGGVEPPIFVSGRAGPVASHPACAAARSGLEIALISETGGKFALVLHRVDALARLLRPSQIAGHHRVRQLARGRLSSIAISSRAHSQNSSSRFGGRPSASQRWAPGVTQSVFRQGMKAAIIPADIAFCGGPRWHARGERFNADNEC